MENLGEALQSRKRRKRTEGKVIEDIAKNISFCGIYDGHTGGLIAVIEN